MIPRFSFLLISLIVMCLNLAQTGHAMAQSVTDQYPPSGEFVDIDGTRLHYVIEGDIDQPALLFLHGASANLKEMQLAFNGSVEGYRAIYLDRPGLGWSERPEGGWSPQREAALIADFLNEIGQASAIIVGHSWGGAISLRLAIDHPDQVDGLVLIAPAARAWVGEAAVYNRLTHWPVIGTLLTRVIVPTYGRSQLEKGAQSAFHPEPMPENYSQLTALPLILRAPVWKANAWDMSRVNQALAEQEVRYDQISAPTVLIAGSDDTVLLTQRHSVPVAETLPNAELILLEGAGHNPHHSYTALIMEAIGSLTSELPDFAE